MTKRSGFDRELQTNNTSGIRGVSFHRGAFQARIRVKGKLEYLGRFTTAEQASKAYEKRRWEVLNADVPSV